MIRRKTAMFGMAVSGISCTLCWALAMLMLARCW
nr:MAG TPA: hypothetical protein [Caudoviricetes sp.]